MENFLLSFVIVQVSGTLIEKRMLRKDKLGRLGTRDYPIGGQ